MKLRKVLTFIILLGLLSRTAPQVLNGRQSRDDSFKYLALLQVLHEDGGSGVGSGVILTEKWILTAAHNFDPHINDDDIDNPYHGVYGVTTVVIKVGTKDMNDVNAQTRVFDDIEDVDDDPRFCIHPNYVIDEDDLVDDSIDSMFDQKYDIALIYLHDRPLQLRQRVVLAVIPNVEPQLQYGTECSITGWGYTQLGQRFSDLRYAYEGNVKVLRPEVCENSFDDDILFGRNNNLCFGCEQGDDPCMCLGRGDSGGPVVCRVNNVETVVAIQTHGQDAGTPCGPDAPNAGVKINRGINEWINGEKLKKSQQECRPYYLMLLAGALAVYCL